MSFYSDSGKFLFIHTPKTGGSTIRNALAESFPDAKYLTTAHECAAEVRTMLTPKRWDAAFKFGFIRSPYTWVESIRRYAMLAEEGAMKRVATKANGPKWAKWLHRACMERRPTENGAIRFQSEYVQGVDVVYRFESFRAARADIGRRLGVKISGHANFNGTKALPLEGEYKAAIEELFARDFNFGV